MAFGQVITTLVLGIGLVLCSTSSFAVDQQGTKNHKRSTETPCNLPGTDVDTSIPGDGKLVIEEIRIIVDDVFPESRAKLAHLANALHRRTRPHVIRNQLLMREGDVFSAEDMRESERILRARSYLYDADIHISEICGSRVKLEVRVRDLWTLVPDLSFSESGGDRSTRLGFRDSNFLGLGKQVVVVRKSDEERAGVTFEYLDPYVLGSRQILRLGYTDNDDGQSESFGLERPFYSLDARWSAGINILRDERTDSLYFRNEVFQEFQHQDDDASLFVGFSTGKIRDRTHRFIIGFATETDEFAVNEDSRSEEILPANRKYRYPWLAWRYIENKFRKVRNVNLINRIEDINFGLDAFVQLGYSDQSFGANDEGWVFNTRFRNVTALTDKQVISFLGRASGFYDKGALLNLRSTLVSSYHNNYTDNLQFYAMLRLSRARNLFAENQLLLGGDTGLRGYPSRYQFGDRQYLLSLEQRFYVNREIWRLFHMGAVIFADTGRSWFADEDNGTNGGPLRNAGFGLRVSPTRSGKNIVLHFDVGFPIGSDDEDIDSYQIRVEALGRF